MSELSIRPARPGAADAVDVTAIARPLGLLVPVAFAPPLWAFCEAGMAEAGVALDAERVARYLLTGLVRALRRHPGAPPQALTWRMALGSLEITLAARVEPGGLHVTGARAVASPPRQVG